MQLWLVWTIERCCHMCLQNKCNVPTVSLEHWLSTESPGPRQDDSRGELQPRARILSGQHRERDGPSQIPGSTLEGTRLPRKLAQWRLPQQKSPGSFKEKTNVCIINLLISLLTHTYHLETVHCTGKTVHSFYQILINIDFPTRLRITIV